MGNRQALAVHLRSIRLTQGFTLQELAAKSGVSRGTLSRIENGEVSPTAETLGRLVVAFSLPMSQLLAPLESGFTALVRRTDQPVWSDPDHGFTRRSVSPPSRQLRMEMLECKIEPHQSISYDRQPIPDREHQLVLLSGKLFLTLEDELHEIGPGDCVRWRLPGPSSYETKDEAAFYLLAMM